MVSEGLVYNPVLARVQGSMLKRGKPGETSLNLQTLIKVVRSVLEEVEKESPEEEKTKREIFLFLLVNSELPWTQDILEIENFSSVAQTCLQLKPEQLIEVVRAVNLWQHLFDCCPFLPAPCLHSLVNLASMSLKGHHKDTAVPDSFNVYIWTRLAGIAKFTPSRDIILKEYMSVILRPAPEDINKRFTSFISVLSVLQTYLRQGLASVSDHSELYTFNVPAPESDVGSECRVEVLSSLLLALKTLLIDLSFESWMEMTEIRSEDLMKHNKISQIWTEDDIPSNLQFVAAHLLARIADLIKGNKPLLTSDPLECKELLSVISGFSREYRRELELGLDDLQLPDLILYIQSSQVTHTEEWRVKAVLERLMSKYLTELLDSESYLEALTPQHSRLTPYLQRIYTALPPTPPPREYQKVFVLTLARAAGLDTLETLRQLSRERRVYLETGTYQEEMVEALNKVSGSATDELRKEFLLLGLQHGERTVESLVTRASQNSGQVHSVAAILQLLGKTSGAGHSEEESFLPGLLAKYILEKRGKEQENTVELYLKMIQSNLTYAVHVFNSLLPNIFQLFTDNQLAECLELVNLCLRSMALVDLLPFLGEAELRQGLVVHAHILNRVYFNRSPTSDLLRMQSLKMVSLLCKDSRVEIDLSALLHPAILSYLDPAGPGRSLQHRVHAAYAQLSDKDDLLEVVVAEDLFSDLLVFLPSATKEEFPFILQVLLRFYRNEEDPELEALVLISDSIQALVSAAVPQEKMERICSSYGSLFTSVIKNSCMEKLARLYSIIVKDIWHIEDICLPKSSRTPSSEASTLNPALTAAGRLCEPLWASCQAAAAQLLSLSPGEGAVKGLLAPLRLLTPSTGRDTLIRIVGNYLEM